MIVRRLLDLEIFEDVRDTARDHGICVRRRTGTIFSDNCAIVQKSMILNRSSELFSFSSLVKTHFDQCFLFSLGAVSH